MSTTPPLLDRYRMIDEIKITNFKRFKELHLRRCRPINVIVGDNGAGKTALLEAIFLALCAHPERALAVRNWRGFDPEFAGAGASIMDAFFGDLFNDPYDLSQVIDIQLKGKGPECRSLKISRAPAAVSIPAGAKSTAESEVLSPIHFDWQDSEGVSRPGKVRVTSSQGIMFDPTGEILPMWTIFPAQLPTSSRETAQKLSDLRKQRKDREFVDLFTSVFDWIEDLTVEEYGGAPMIHAALRNKDRLYPLPSVSGAINRAAAFLLTMASRKRGLVLIDEVDNGVFHTKHEALARLIIKISRQYETQVFLSTHSAEWLRAFVRAAGDDVSDICLWRLSATSGDPEVTWFGGKTFKAGVESEGEVR